MGVAFDAIRAPVGLGTGVGPAAVGSSSVGAGVVVGQGVKSTATAPTIVSSAGSVGGRAGTVSVGALGSTVGCSVAADASCSRSATSHAGGGASSGVAVGSGTETVIPGRVF